MVDWVVRLLIVAALTLLSLVVFLAWIWPKDPYFLFQWWNRQISWACDEQDIHGINGIPSLRDAWNCPCSAARRLHRSIILNEEIIRKEVREAINSSGKGVSELWVKFLGDSTVSPFPTLSRIAVEIREVVLMNVSICWPGATQIEHRGPSRAVYRYHFGLCIPRGDSGLRILDRKMKWREGNGFVWDETLPHSLWNRTSEPRILICADVLRDLDWIGNLGSRIIYNMAVREARKAKERLSQKGIVLVH